MADKKISALTSSTTPLAGTEVLPVVQSGVTKQVSVENLTSGRTVSMLRSDVTNGTATGTMNLGGGTVVNLGSYTNHPVQMMVNNQTNGIWDTSRNLKLIAGNLIIGTSGKGIDFSATSDATGMTSELLDDYEEGTWTPNQGAGITLVGSFSSSAVYTKIGRQVNIYGKLQGSTSIAVLGAGGTLFSNAPFAPSASSTGVLINDAQDQSGAGVLATNSVFYITPMAATPIIYFNITYFV